jgi:hypothetical protein
MSMVAIEYQILLFNISTLCPVGSNRRNYVTRSTMVARGGTALDEIIHSIEVS